jgi:hypothetical protein
MGKIDTYTDNYWNLVRFADICNATMFDGEDIVRPEELSEAENSMSFAGGRESVKLMADKVRRWKGKWIRIVCVENQSYIDYRMVLRCMLLDALGYHSQWKEKAAAHRKNKDLKADEFMSGIRRDEKFVPIITIVVYYGEKPWNAARRLYELLDVCDGEDMDTLKGVISDYKINLFDYHDYKEFDFFRTDLKNLFEFLRYSDDKEEIKQRVQNDKEYRTLSEDTTFLLEKLTNTKIFKNEKNREQKWRRGDMCKAFEDYKEEGRQEGRMEGRQEGRQEGRKNGSRC